MPRFRTVLLTATVLAMPLLVAPLLHGGPAMAQRLGATYDLAQLPQTRGTVAQYLLTPRGDVDGLLLADGTEVHFPPFASTQIVFAIKPGDEVVIQGLRAKALPMVAAMAITNAKTGAIVTMPPGPRGMMAETHEAQGTIKAVLHDTRGEVTGALLDDGTTVRLPPPEAKRVAAQIVVGQPLYARGPGHASQLGRAVFARTIGPDKDHLTQINLPKMMEHGPGMMRERMMGRLGPEGMPRP